MSEPKPLDTLETRLERIEAMIENIQDAVTLDAYGLHSKLLNDIEVMLAKVRR